LGSELVLLDLDGGPALLQARDAASGDELQLAFIVKLSGPAYRKFQPFSGNQDLISGKKHPIAAYINRLSRAFFVAIPLVKNAISHLSLNGEAVCIASLSTGGTDYRAIWQQGNSFLRKQSMRLSGTGFNRSKTLINRLTSTFYL
jgi:hypothetical protein